MQRVDPRDPTQYGHSTIADIAGLWLLAMGVLLAIPALFVLFLAVGGALVASQTIPTAFGGGDAVLAVVVVAVPVLLGPIAHVLAAIGVFTHKRWARWLGVTVGIIGVGGGVFLLSAQINARGLARFNWWVVGLILAYAFTVAALSTRTEHFRVRPRDSRTRTVAVDSGPPPSN